ncbi:MAG: ABC-2 transporter permease [Pseudomonadota bacterium]
MKPIFTIARREFSAYFTSPIAYVYLITFLVIANWLFFRAFFLIGQSDMRAFFAIMPWIFLFFVPAVAMGKWAEERKQGTLEILFTLPIRDRDIVIAKFAAGLALIASALLLTVPVAVTVALLGDMDWGPVIGGYAGLILLGGAYLAIGLVVSALTENQIIAFIVGVAVCFLMLIVGTSMVVGGASNLLTQALQYLGLATHFESIGRGVVDSRDIIYYLSVIGFFLFLNLKVLETRARR